VRAVEAWGHSPAAFARPEGIEVVARYPDRGHGSFTVLAPPPDTALVSFPVLAGRWLTPQDNDAVVLNHVAAAERPQAKIGDRIALSIGGRVSTWTLTGVVEEIGAAGVAYVSAAAFAEAQATPGRAQLLRVALKNTEPDVQRAAVEAIEARLARAGAAIQSTLPLSTLRTAMSEHILILIRSLIAMALVMAVVGGLGLSSAMGTSVLEREREFAVMKTLGATPMHILRAVLAEALAIAALSGLGAIVLALPLTAAIDELVGRLGFIAPLPLTISAQALLIWLALLALLAPLATALAARRAAWRPVAPALAAVS
jgi:putative ABC transport system permease protein